MQVPTVPDMTTGPRRIANTRFIERLASEMDRAGIANKNQLAKAVGVSRDTAGTWLNGSSDPSGPNLGNLADYFGCTMDYLWGRVDSRQEVYTVLPRRLMQAVDKIMSAAEQLEEFSTPYELAADPEAAAEGLADAAEDALRGDETPSRRESGRAQEDPAA